MQAAELRSTESHTCIPFTGALGIVGAKRKIEVTIQVSEVNVNNFSLSNYVALFFVKNVAQVATVLSISNGLAQDPAHNHNLMCPFTLHSQ